MISLKEAAFNLGQRTAQQMYQAEVPLKKKENVSQTFTPMYTNGATSGGY